MLTRRRELKRSSCRAQIKRLKSCCRTTWVSVDLTAPFHTTHDLVGADSTAEMAAITPHIQPLLAELGDETDPYLLYL